MSELKPVNRQNIIFQTSDISAPKSTAPRLYIKEQHGHFQKIRRSLGLLLMLIFIGLPMLKYDGEQAIIFNVVDQYLKVFTYYFYPQDLVIFTFVLIIAAFILFYVSTKYGRLWCGFACPQTIWTLLFIWVEHRIEGNRQQKIKLDKSKYNINKLSKKALKHGIWLLLSLATGLVFMSYFISVETLYIEFFTFNASGLVTFWVLFFAICTYVNASFIREKMCQHMCPYARFQAVMINPTTKTVSYDKARGEHRGPRKRNTDKPDNLGDCVDCNLCVVVCPVGIDIRDGLQYDCINCGLCIDACDQTMDTFSYPKGLISFASETTSARRSRVNYAYITVIILSIILLGFWVANRSQVEVSVLRDRNTLYRLNTEGKIENSYQLKLLNKSSAPMSFNLTHPELEHFNVSLSSPIIVEAQTSSTYTVTLIAPTAYQQKFQQFEFVLIEQKQQLDPVKVDSTFISF